MRAAQIAGEGGLAPILRLITGLLLILPAVALGQEVSAGKPKLVIQETNFDFGAINAGSKVKHEFAFRNEGDADLVVQRIVSPCGCTVANSSSNGVIAAKSAGTFNVEFDSTGFAGEKYKPITVYSNDPDRPTLQLSIKAKVNPEVEVSPQNILFGDVVKSRGSLDQQVTISIPAGSKASIGDVRAFSKYIKLSEISASPRQRKLAVSLAPNAPLGELRDRVIVSLLNSATETINIPVFGVIKGDIKLSPSALSFGIIEGTQPLKRSVKVENFSTSALEVKDVISDNPAVSATVKTIKPGSIYVLDVSVDPTQVKHDLRASLQIPSAKQGESVALSIYGVAPGSAN